MQAKPGELGALRLQLGLLTHERAPVVDQQEDLPVAAGVETGPAERMPGGHRVDPQVTEPPLALQDQGTELAHEAADPFGLARTADRPDVRQVVQSMEEPAAEVHGVDPDLVGRVGGGQGGHEGAEQRALARPGGADHGKVAGAPRQVKDERPLLLFERPVDHSHRHLEPAAMDGPEQRVQGQVGGERREPDLVRRPAGADQAADQGLQVG